ncbi:MAG TPA: DUF2254 domain-containing protein, partial [Flavisolibacter sp.]|nr:DUF2254 domain-containing protein [Flavisolibacter sp.]
MPLVMMAMAVILWTASKAADQSLSTREKHTIAWLYISDTDSMRTLLLTIAGAIAGIAGVVFSIIMVPLSIAATQFGPRLLRSFLRDTGTQFTLGTLTGTLVYCMLVLLHLPKSNTQPLPQISVNTALLLGLTSFGVLLFFINHVAVSIQSPVLVARVSKELNTAIEHDLPDFISTTPGIQETQRKDFSFDLNESYGQISATGTGYVKLRDDEGLLAVCIRHNLVLQLLYEPGDFLIKGQPLARVWPAGADKKICLAVNQAFDLGARRTLVQDVTFGINELVEVAVRALSPSINDPFTAMTCLDWLGAALCKIYNRRLPPDNLYDDEGHLRLIRRPVTFTGLTNAAFHQIREYGRTSSAVMLRLIQTIGVVATNAINQEQRDVLLKHTE